MADNNISNLLFLAFSNIQYFQKTIFVTDETGPCTTNCLRILFRMDVEQNGVIVRPSEAFTIFATKIIPYLPLAQIIT